jgi:phosphoglycolate phosphatase
LNVDLIVFDLDGTLIDSRRDLADATNAMLVSFGASPLATERVAAMVGEGAPVLVRRALTAAGLDPETPDALDRFLTSYDERLLIHTRPYDGMPETLARLRAVSPLTVLTNKPGRATMRILEGLRLDAYFKQVLGGDTPYGRKPNPGGLRHLMAAAQATASTTVLVGDSRIDLQTARGAGVRICLARYGFGFTLKEEELRRDDVLIDHPRDLTRWFELK